MVLNEVNSAQSNYFQQSVQIDHVWEIVIKTFQTRDEPRRYI